MQINGLTVLISGNYNVFNEGWNGAGVYACSGNYTSEVFKQPIYIGSSVNLQDRIESNHIVRLNRNKHPHNKPLQNSWNKYGSENFIWILLETCQPCETLIVEQKYLDLYRPFIDEFGGFNICHSAAASMKDRIFSSDHRKKISDANRGKTHLEETKQKMSESHKRLYEERLAAGKINVYYGHKQSEETKKKISQKLKGKKFASPRKPVSDETRKKLSESQKKRIYLPEQKKAMAEICSIRNKSDEFILNNTKGPYFIVSPDGNRIKVQNLKKFCRENNLEFSTMLKVMKGKFKQHKGWTKCVENL